MRTRHLLFLISFITLIIVGTLIFLNQRQVATENSKLTLQEQIDKINNDYRKGFISREEANEKFCFMKVRSENDRQEAVNVIKSFVNDPDIAVEYRCNNFSSNNPNLNPTEETYSAGGKFYFVDIATNKVLRVQ